MERDILNVNLALRGRGIFEVLFMNYTLLSVMRNISSRFANNSETNISELLENLDELFFRYYMLKYSTTQ